jgi:hypothetical protein
MHLMVPGCHDDVHNALEYRKSSDSKLLLGTIRRYRKRLTRKGWNMTPKRKVFDIAIPNKSYHSSNGATYFRIC